MHNRQVQANSRPYSTILPAELLYEIVHHSDMETLIVLLHDKVFRSMAEKELEKAFKDLLGRFAAEPEGIRSMMKRTGSVITGSAALWYLLRRPCGWEPSDLDIVTPHDMFQEVIQSILEMHPEAQVKDLSASSNDAHYPIEAYEGRMVIETGKGRMDILQSREDCPFYPIAHYWSTHLMNALTSEAVVCGYPALTLQRKGVAVEGGIPGPVDRIQKYTERGIEVYKGCKGVLGGNRSCREFEACGKLDRFFGDEHTMVIPTRGGTIMESANAFKQEELTGWRLGGEGCSNEECFLESNRVIAIAAWDFPGSDDEGEEGSEGTE